MSKMEKVVKTDKSQKTWVILGTKRGGTSFLAQILGENGVEIATCGNGHNEDLDFVLFNEMILEEAGGDWNHLPHDEYIGQIVRQHRGELQGILADKKEDGDDWGWKDPRQGATIKHILPYLDDDVYIVAVFRKPDIAAASMHRTWPRHSLEFCRKVVTDYNKRILDALEEFTK